METINAMGIVGAFDKSVILIQLPTVLSKHTHKMFFPDVSYPNWNVECVYFRSRLIEEKNKSSWRKKIIQGFFGTFGSFDERPKLMLFERGPIYLLSVKSVKQKGGDMRLLN